jgi:glutathione S-transferase
MSLTFYRAPMSTATITELVLAELGIPHETVTLDIQKGDTKKPEFLKVNPNGKVPVIVHDGTVIFESAAITIHLGDTFGVEKSVWPSDRLKRGEAMKWVVWTNVSLGDAVARWMRNTMDWFPAEQRNAKAGEAGQKEMRELLGILDASLEGRDYLCGAAFTLADVHLNSYLDWLRYSKVDFTPFARIEAWGKRCSSRPAYQKIMADKKG